jgi:putative MATE family efflux protein
MNINSIAVAPVQPAAAELNPKIRRLLEGPILPTLLKLAAPNLADAAARVTFLTLDAYFVSLLGSDALAGVALVFPFFLLMQSMATAAMGGGVSSAVARALGAGNRDDANALIWHGAAIALAMSAAFLFIFVFAGPALYSAMGAKGKVLEAAITYSQVVFCGGIFVWLMNIFANVVRGTGAMLISASAIVIAEIVHVACAPALILGLAGLPSLGVAGAGIGVIVSYAAGTLALVVYLASHHASVQFARPRFERRLFAAILRVGALSSVNILQNQATYIVLGILVTSFGGSALAGFGAAVRVEYSMTALVFTVGVATVTMIGANMGAGKTQRAIRIGWTGAAIGGSIAGTVGTLGALFTPQWMGLFTADPQITAIGASYLATNQVAYALLGVGSGLFYASQGLGSVSGPFLAQTSRLALLVIIGWVAMPISGGGLTGLFVANAGTIAWVGTAIIFVFWRGSRKLTPRSGRCDDTVVD